MEKERDSKHQAPEFVEILGDTVSPNHVLYSIIISIILGLGGFLIGMNIFPAFADEKMVASYSLLLGIGGCVVALILCASLFHPKRILTETETILYDKSGLIQDLQVDFKEEYEVLKNDAITRKEMEDLKIKNLFIQNEEGN